MALYLLGFTYASENMQSMYKMPAQEKEMPKQLPGNNLDAATG